MNKETDYTHKSLLTGTEETEPNVKGYMVLVFVAVSFGAGFLIGLIVGGAK